MVADGDVECAKVALRRVATSDSSDAIDVYDNLTVQCPNLGGDLGIRVAIASLRAHRSVLGRHSNGAIFPP
jgi:hypothetical protein